MRSILRYLARWLRVFLYLMEAFASRDRRYVRMTLKEKGNIWFFDRNENKCFSIASRGRSDSDTADQLFKKGDYDFGLLARSADISTRYDECVRANRQPLIIDCGANIGMSAKYFSERFPEARIVAIEPDVRNMNLAKQNCESLTNIDFKLAAIGSTAGTVKIVDPTAEPSWLQVTREESSDGIPIETISGLLAEYEKTELFVVKIDIEGFESDLFKTNTEWIDECEVLIIELHDWRFPGSANSHAFIKSMSERKRDFVFKGENVFSIRN